MILGERSLASCLHLCRNRATVGAFSYGEPAFTGTATTIPVRMVRKLIASTCALTLAACSLTPEYETPAMETPAHWRDSESAAADTISAVTADWWRQYDSAELAATIEEALDRNNDLRAALHHIEQSRASAKVAGAGLYPAVDASGNATRRYIDTGTEREDTSFSAQLSVAYEVDLWRRNQAALDAALSRVDATVFDRDALGLVVMSDTARSWLQVVNLRERQQIARANLDNGREVLAIVEARFREGAASALEVSQQRTAVANAEAALAALVRQERIAEDSLAVLRGLAPVASTVTAQTLQDLTLPAVAAGQPSALLGRRPDIRRAESDLIAANADIGVARAAFYPQVQLGIDTALTASPGAAAAALIASIFQPVFQGGALEGQLEGTRARQAELAENYRTTVLTSFQEVEDALASVRAARERVALFDVAAEAARQAYQISRERYVAGAIDFLSLLDTQRSLLLAEDNFAQARFDQFTASVDLFKALGGGWEPERAPATPPM